MSSTRTIYRRALADLDGVITSFPDDRWESDTPCEGWTARTLAGHVIDGQHQVASMLAGELRAPVTDAAELAAVAGHDPVTEWTRARAAVESVLDGLVEGAIVTSPRGDVPVDELLATAMIEPLVHGWDLAVAAGRSIVLDPEGVEAVLGALEHSGDMLAASGMFAPARPVHDGMSAQDRLVALTGRDPSLAMARSTPEFG